METNLSLWIRRIIHTQTEEINCSACLDQVSQYVDLELAQANAAEQLPLVRQHLEQCGVCFEEYQVLSNLARMQRDRDLPSGMLTARSFTAGTRTQPAIHRPPSPTSVSIDGSSKSRVAEA
jgi:predicted anti-sigma-YlaC factor YlaD